MGTVAEILQSPEWANKSALEKAAARKDFFAITLDENPDFKAAFVAADAPTRQTLADGWKAKLTASFPTAFKTKGFDVKLKSGGEFSESGAEAPVYDYATETLLDRLAPVAQKGEDFYKDSARLKLINSFSKEDRQKILPLYMQRYGTAFSDQIGSTKDLYDENNSLLDKTIGVIAPMAARTIPTLLSTPTRNPKLIAASAALGEATAQGVEQMLGQREGYNITEGAVNAAFNAINPIKMNPNAGALMRAGGRAAEGAALTGTQNIIQQSLFSDKPPSLTEFGVSLGAGGVLGGGVEGLGQLSSAIKARLIGKSPQVIQKELPDLIAKATPEEKQALTDLQKRIEQSLGLDSRELAPATLVGIQEGLPDAGIPDTPLYNLTRDAAGTVQDSTVTRQTLEGAGFRVPEPPPSLRPGRRVEIPVADLEPNAARSAGVFQEALEAPNPAAADTALASQLQAEATPANAQITVMQMGNKRAVQVDIPGAAGERPIFSGSPEDAVAAGYDFKLPAELPEGRYTYDQINPSAYEQNIPPSTSQGSTQPNVETTVGSQEIPRSQPEVDEVGSQGQSPQSVTLPPQAQRIYDTYGGVDPVLVRALASGGTGLAGGAYGLTQGDTSEERIKNGLAYAVLGAGGGYAAGRSFTRLMQQRPNVTGTPELDVWYKRLSKPESGVELSKKVRDLPNTIRARLTTSMAPLDKLPREIAAANNTPLKEPALPLSRQFETVNGASGKALVDAQDYADSVLSKVSENEWQDFNALMAIKRTGQRLQADANLATDQARIQAIPEAQRTPQEAEILSQQPDRRRVAGETLQSVDAALAGLEKKLGSKRFTELDQLAAGPVQQEADKALRVMVASGRMSPEQYAGIKASNDFYAPFRVMQYAEDFDGFPGMKANPVDTTQKYTQAIRGIDSADFQLDDPAKVMMEKIFQARILAEKNLKMKALADMADDDASGTVVKKLGANESAPRGMETVNYFDNGVARQLAVPPDVAEAVKGMNPASTGLISRFVRAVNKPFRFGATAGNIGFQTVNAPADLFRQATMSKYGIGRGDAIVDTLRYPADFVHALYSSILSRPAASTATGAVAGFYGGYESGGTTPERFRNAAAGAVLGGLAGRGVQRGVGAGVNALRQAGATDAADALDPNALYRQFYQSGAAGSTLQDMITSVGRDKGRTTAAQQLKGPGVINTLQDFGKAIEETTKLLGFKRGMRIEGIDKLSKQAAYNKLQEVVSETRNFAGSPDFSVGGDLVKDLNAAIVFLNPRIQGMVEDGGRLFGRDGAAPAAKAWTALGASVGTGAAYLWYRNNQPENKADYAQVSPEEKWRYAMIPRYTEDGKPLTFTNERGQVVREYYRVPLRDTAQNFYQMVQSSMDFAQSKDPQKVAQFGAELLENLSPVNIQGDTAAERAESAISSFGPVGTIPYMLATQRIPGLHRDIMQDDAMRQASPENQFTATTPQAYRDMAQLAPQWLADPLRSPVMLEQLVASGTGGIASQFTPPRATPGRDETATNLQQSPLGRRFVRSGYVYEPAPEAARDALRTQADAAVTEKRTGTELFMELSQLPADQRAARYRELPKEDRSALREEFTRRQKRPATEEIALIRRMGIENGTRANYVFDRLSKLTPPERAEFIKDLEQAKVFSDDLKKQISFLLKRQSSAQPGRN